ncbi:MAG: MFS transporter [Proteobacteria bacterium]|nr:MFS transporter [Pseudomonadota bacterium]
MNQIKSVKNIIPVNYLAWLIITLFYFYQYILRVSPGIMVVELREIFKLTAQEFSSLGAIYLFSYSLLQIPLGFILDYFGARRVMMFSILTCIAGTCLFAYAQSVWMLQVGRFLIGLGSAPAFIGALKLVSDHLPKKYHGLFMGITLAIGTLGALLSGKFLVSILDMNGWQNTLLLCAGFGGVILLLTFVLIPKTRQSSPAILNSFSHFRLGIIEVFKQKEIIIYAIIAICVYTPLCVLADLWGTAFLMEKFSLSRANAAQLSLYLYGGLTLGSLVLPWLSLKMDRLKIVIQICIVGIMVSLSILLFANHLNTWQLAMILSLIGIFCGAEMICFAGAAQASPSAHSGLTLGVVNTLNMLGGALIQQIIGWYLDMQWKGQFTQEGARFYSATELSLAFSLLVLIIFICGLLSLKLAKKRPYVTTQVQLA